jgi:hypothetical protein
MSGPHAQSQVRHLVVRANVALPGLYAWASTVAAPGLGRQAPLSARVAAYGALAGLLLAVVVLVEYPRVARGFGVFGFVGLSVASWLLLGPLLDVGRLSVVRATCGGVGWALFAIGWGLARPLGPTASEDDAAAGSRLVARDHLPRGAAAVVGIGVVGAAVPWLLAWRVTRPEHALLAHGFALLCAVALLATSARVALERGARLPVAPARARLRGGVGPLMAVAGLLALGFIWRLLH